MLTSATGQSLSTLNSKFFNEKLCIECIGNCNSLLFKRIITKFEMLKEYPGTLINKTLKYKISNFN